MVTDLQVRDTATHWC